MKDKNDLKLLDVMCKWYIWAVVGLVIGNWLSDTLGSLIGLALGSLIGWYIQKNDNGNLKITKKDRLKITNYGEKTKSIWLSFHFVYT